MNQFNSSPVLTPLGYAEGMRSCFSEKAGHEVKGDLALLGGPQKDLCYKLVSWISWLHDWHCSYSYGPTCAKKHIEVNIEPLEVAIDHKYIYI